MLVDMDINFTATDVPYCWGMSKMTVTRETKMYDKHDTMQPVEFYEFIARCAESKYPSEGLLL